jgi:hypothetical protein
MFLELIGYAFKGYRIENEGPQLKYSFLEYTMSFGIFKWILNVVFPRKIRIFQTHFEDFQ